MSTSRKDYKGEGFKPKYGIKESVKKYGDKLQLSFLPLMKFIGDLRRKTAEIQQTMDDHYFGHLRTDVIPNDFPWKTICSEKTHNQELGRNIDETMRPFLNNILYKEKDPSAIHITTKGDWRYTVKLLSDSDYQSYKEQGAKIDPIWICVQNPSTEDLKADEISCFAESLSNQNKWCIIVLPGSRHNRI